MSALLAPSPVQIGIFDAAREGSRAPAKVGICEWAEREIRILKGSEKGRLRLARTPYMRGMLEAWTDRRVMEITFKTASQVAKTTLMMIYIAYAMDEEPDDALYVMPSEELAREISVERIRPLLHASPALRKQFTEVSEDQQAVRYKFLRGTLFFAWAKSPATLSSRPVRYVLLDETGKYPTFSGKEADPMSLAAERAKTFPNRKIVVASTPTTPDGIVSTQFKLSDQRRYHVPCIKCGVKQVLISQFLKWPAGVDADTIESQELAWYECRACGAQMRDRDKTWMLANGEWIAENPKAIGHAGFHLSTLYSPFVRWSAYAKKFLVSKARPELLMNFTNSWEGEDWVEKAAKVTTEGIETLKVKYELGVVPPWALMLTFGSDVQEEYVKYVVRAWGTGRRSRLIDLGMFPRSKDENGLWKVDKETGIDDDLLRLEREVLPTRYKYEDGNTIGIYRAYIDRGYRTSAVDKLCWRNPHMLFGVKGANEVQYEGEGGGIIQEREVRPHKNRNFSLLPTKHNVF